jgi:hypothetical protein
MVFNKTNKQRFDPDTHYAVTMQPPPAYTHHIKRRCLDVPYTPFPKSCPSNAISTEDKVMCNGFETWKLDIRRCARFNFTDKNGWRPHDRP